MTIQEARDVRGRRPQARHGGGATMALLVGGLCGLAWAAGLRGFMAEVAGAESGVDWAGTFGWILVPGIGVGALLGWAEHLRRSGGRRGWRWLALSPLLFSAILFSRPLDLLSIFEDGVGGGDGDLLRRTRPRAGHPAGAWVAVYYWSFLAVLMLACAIPHRAVTPQHAA